MSNRRQASLWLWLFRMVVAALFLGTLMFPIVLLWLGFMPQAGVPLLGDYMTYAAIGISTVAIAANIGLSVVSRKWSQSGNSRVPAAIALRTIGGALIFAFAGFFGAAALMLEQSWAALIVAIVMTIGVVSRFPLNPFIDVGVE